MPNWKAPGPGNVQGYWLKNLTPLHDKLVVYLQDCLYSGVIPDWLTKDEQCFYKRIRPRGIWQTIIDPLHVTLSWKLLAGILADEIYDYLEKKMLLPEEQNGCRR